MNQYHEKLVNIIKDYLGPAATRFLDRQIDFHLEKNPSELEKADIQKLAEMTRSALGMVAQDKQAVDECYKRMIKISQSNE